jgi:hypothetical protein
MRFAAAVVLVALVIQGCSREDEGQSAEDFAARVGARQEAAAPDPAAQESVPVATPPPANVDVRNLEPLGNIAGADLGPRDGGCTFTVGESPLLLAGALNDPASTGKAVVRAGGKLYLLGSAPGGLGMIRQGSRFSGEGVTVDVTPAAGQAAVLKVTDGQGRSANISGTWICA